MDNWKDVIGYEGLYQVSDLGGLRSVDRYVDGKNGKRLIKGTLRKCFSNSQGYVCSALYKDNKSKKVRVHRLVCEAFIENTENKLFVNHMNAIKYDNRVDNLEWVTKKENHAHALYMGLITQAKPVLQCDMDWNLVDFFPSVGNAIKETCISNIDAVVIGNQRTAGGFNWRYLNQ